jgi:hypothetical protein
MIKQIAKDFFIKWQQACYVCFPMMVQGNLFALTFDHWIKANKTGIIAGLGAVLLGYTVLKKYKDKKWFHGVTIASACFIGDLMVHPSHFAGAFGEAALTAMASGLLATYFVYKPLSLKK